MKSSKFIDLLGSSIYLKVLDLFLENPDRIMNLREIARMIGKNPGSISRILPKLIENEILKQIKVGKVSYVYTLNKENKKVILLLEFYNKLKEIID